MKLVLLLCIVVVILLVERFFYGTICSTRLPRPVPTIASVPEECERTPWAGPLCRSRRDRPPKVVRYADARQPFGRGGGTGRRPPKGAEAHQTRIAVVTANFICYDQLMSPISGPGVDFFVFVGINETHCNNVPGWKVIETPYHLRDVAVDVGAKNSLSNTRLPFRQRMSFYNRYYRMMAWRTPELRPYRYVMYIDSNVDVRSFHLRRDMFQMLDHGRYELITIQHPARTTIVSEAAAANGQERYRHDHVIEQAQHYVRDHLFPDNIGLRWSGLFLYDIASLRVRRFLEIWYQEVQIWSLECQVSMSFAIWKANLTAHTLHVPGPTLCKQVTNSTAAICRRGHRVQKGYGKWE